MHSIIPLPYFKGYLHVGACAVYVVGVKGGSVAPFKNAAFAAGFAVVQAFPGFEHVGEAFLFCGIFYTWRCHCSVALMGTSIVFFCLLQTYNLIPNFQAVLRHYSCSAANKKGSRAKMFLAL